MSSTLESVAVKIMPVLKPGVVETKVDEPITRSPEPIQLENLLHEIHSLKALEKLKGERKYAVPSGHTGFNPLVQYLHIPSNVIIN